MKKMTSSQKEVDMLGSARIVTTCLVMETMVTWMVLMVRHRIPRGNHQQDRHVELLEVSIGRLPTLPLPSLPLDQLEQQQKQINKLESSNPQSQECLRPTTTHSTFS